MILLNIQRCNREPMPVSLQVSQYPRLRHFRQNYCHEFQTSVKTIIKTMTAFLLISTTYLLMLIQFNILTVRFFFATALCIRFLHFSALPLKELQVLVVACADPCQEVLLVPQHAQHRCKSLQPFCFIFNR